MVVTIFLYLWLFSSGRKGCEDAKYLHSDIPCLFYWVLRELCVHAGGVGWGEAWLVCVPDPILQFYENQETISIIAESWPLPDSSFLIPVQQLSE